MDAKILDGHFCSISLVLFVLLLLLPCVSCRQTSGPLLCRLLLLQLFVCYFCLAVRIWPWQSLEDEGLAHWKRFAKSEQTGADIAELLHQLQLLMPVNEAKMGFTTLKDRMKKEQRGLIRLPEWKMKQNHVQKKESRYFFVQSWKRKFAFILHAYSSGLLCKYNANWFFDFMNFRCPSRRTAARIFSNFTARSNGAWCSADDWWTSRRWNSGTIESRIYWRGW